MPNKPEERLLLKGAANRIFEKYKKWVGDNRHLRALLESTDEQFDKIIEFMNPPEFLEFQRAWKYQVSEGAEVAALTISSPNDDEMPNYRRRIVFSRTFICEHTFVHELMHFVSHARFRRELPLKLDEGFTEYFTHKIVGSSDASIAAAAAKSDSKFTVTDEYAAFLKVGQKARAFIKESILPMVKDNREYVIKMSTPSAAAAAASPMARPSSSASSASRRGGVIMERAQLDQDLKAESNKWNRITPSSGAGREGMLGRERDTKNFMSDPYDGLSLKDFTKKAYFLGDPVMIKLIKDGAGI